MSGTGPADTTGAEPSYDVIGAASPRLSDRWAALPTRYRRAAQLLLAAAATAVALTVLRPTPGAPALGPPPSQVTSLHYDGPGTTGRDRRSATFRFTVSVRNRTPVTIEHIGADIPGLSTHTTPAPPLTVKAAAPRHIAVRILVRDCSAPPRGINVPHLDLIVHTPRAQQPYSFLFGGGYPRDLSHLLTTPVTSKRGNTALPARNMRNALRATSTAPLRPPRPDPPRPEQDRLKPLSGTGRSHDAVAVRTAWRPRPPALSSQALPMA